ncbi:hypothetical protein HAZT_HAZT003707 [Hyalella azteca]|uniref:Laminin N-terminal domain-containing protein n=1 Tax=Hyalella azteca TaxID=294128 RepID=A0A6A0GQW1_HYAAZ|nr:hypothetical protein HAZT_HAZT003707 [Hyalella azteca]
MSSVHDDKTRATARQHQPLVANFSVPEAGVAAAATMAPSVTYVLLYLFTQSSVVLSEVLTPPYFNLAENRRITATATCGEAVPQEELYCKLIGANVNRDVKYNLIQGQVCDVCDPSNPSKWHPPEYAIDGSERWWQSPPLSRGMQYNQVNLTVDLGQVSKTLSKIKTDAL